MISGIWWLIRPVYPLIVSTPAYKSNCIILVSGLIYVLSQLYLWPDTICDPSLHSVISCRRNYSLNESTGSAFIASLNKKCPRQRRQHLSC